MTPNSRPVSSVAARSCSWSSLRPKAAEPAGPSASRTRTLWPTRLPWYSRASAGEPMIGPTPLPTQSRATRAMPTTFSVSSGPSGSPKPVSNWVTSSGVSSLSGMRSPMPIPTSFASTSGTTTSSTRSAIGARPSMTTGVNRSSGCGCPRRDAEERHRPADDLADDLAGPPRPTRPRAATRPPPASRRRRRSGPARRRGGSRRPAGRTPSRYAGQPPSMPPPLRRRARRAGRSRPATRQRVRSSVPATTRIAPHGAPPPAAVTPAPRAAPRPAPGCRDRGRCRP